MSDKGEHRSAGSRSRGEALALLVPVALLWALHGRTLGSWWIRDDPCHLVAVLDHGLFEPFVRAIGIFLTPWINLSLGLDLHLFGLEPAAFYGHQLVSASLLLAVAYFVLRPGLSHLAAGLALTLFTVSVPTFAVVRQLMNRHYLEGLVLALASLLLYRRSLASGRPALRLSLAAAGAGCYLLAASAKEVFVPWVLLLPFAATGDLRRRLRHALPYAAAGVVYVAWRLLLLGPVNSVSAYGAAGEEAMGPALLEVAGKLGVGAPWRLAAVAAVAAAAAAVLAARRPRMLAPAALTVAVALLPLAPVATRLEPRHFFVPVFVAAVAVAAALERAPLGRSRWTPAVRAGLGLALVVLAFSSLRASSFRAGFDDMVESYRGEGSFLLEGPDEAVLATRLGDVGYLRCTARLRREVLGDAEGPGFCGDPCFCAETLGVERLWQLPEGREIAPAAAGCARPSPLEVHLRHDRRLGRISWRLGPHADGHYEALLVSSDREPEVSPPVPLPREGSLPYYLFEPLRFAVRYRSPGGERSYSPIYVVEPGGEARPAD